jgi:hypothetical protein
MSKTTSTLAPFAAVLLGLGVAIWFLVSQGWAVGWWLLSAFLVAHGVVHILFVVPDRAELATIGKRVGLTSGEMQSIGTVLGAVVVFGFLFAGLATLLGSGWWGLLVAVSAVASAAMLGLFFSPQLVLGLGIDAVLLFVVVSGVWHP